MLSITKRHNSVNTACGVTVLIFCTSSDHGLDFTKFCKNILNALRFMERTRFQYLLLQGCIIP